MRRRFFLIFNSTAGTSKRAAVDALTAVLDQAGCNVTRSTALTAASAQADAHEAAVSGRYDAVIAAGGDGTIRQIAAAVRDTGVPLGVVPLGTGNVLSYELNLPKRSADLALALMHGQTVTADLGLANGEPFLLMAGAGFDGRVIAALDHTLKNSIAKLAYIKPCLQALSAPLDPLSVMVDGARFSARWVIITNAERYGGKFRLAPSTHVTSPGLVAVLVDAPTKAKMVAHLMALATGRFAARAASDPTLTMIPCHEAVVSAQQPVPCQIDGDAFGTTPLRVSTGGGKVAIITSAGITSTGITSAGPTA